MYKSVGVFPVLPGKDAKQVAAVLRGDPNGYAESRRAVGIHLERGYEIPTPMGTFLISYIESDISFAEASAAIARSELAIDRAFIAAAKEVHGLDLTAPPPSDAIEVLGDWEDEAVTTRKRGLAFCAPVNPGYEDRGRAFATEAYLTRRDEFGAARRAVGVSRETIALNHTPAGDVVGVYFEADDPAEANRRFAASQEPFDVWFKNEVSSVLPPDIDLNQPLPPIEEIFDSQEVLVAR
jgi:hypothetical protein